MLRFPLVFAITLYPLSVYAQQINGLGDLKLGMSFSTFEQWVEQKGKTIKEYRGFDPSSLLFGERLRDRDPASSSVMEIVAPLPNTENSLYSPSYTNYLQDYRSISINLYSVSGIEIRDLHLLFKNEELVYIGADMTEDLEEALTAKYGNPIEKIESKDITCTYTFTGAKFKKTQLSRYATWRHDSIIAEGHDYGYYDSECKLNSGSLFTIERIDMDNDKGFKGINAYLRRNLEAEIAYEKTIKRKKMRNMKKSLDKL